MLSKQLKFIMKIKYIYIIHLHIMEENIVYADIYLENCVKAKNFNKR